MWHDDGHGNVVYEDCCIVMHSGGGTDRLYMSELTFKEANEICEAMNWEFVDENCFVWDLSIEDMN